LHDAFGQDRELDHSPIDGGTYSLVEWELSITDIPLVGWHGLAVKAMAVK
jgi:hypothetical protein